MLDGRGPIASYSISNPCVFPLAIRCSVANVPEAFPQRLANYSSVFDSQRFTSFSTWHISLSLQSRTRFQDVAKRLPLRVRQGLL